MWIQKLVTNAALTLGCVARQDALLRTLVEEVGVKRPKRKDFEAMAARLGTSRTGYAVEQHWFLYLADDAKKKAGVAQPDAVAPPEAAAVADAEVLSGAGPSGEEILPQDVQSGA